MDVAGIVMGPPGVEAATGGRVRRVPFDGRLKPLRHPAARRTIGRAIRAVEPDLVSMHFALYGAVTATEQRARADKGTRPEQGRTGWLVDGMAAPWRFVWSLDRPTVPARCAA